MKSAIHTLTALAALVSVAACNGSARSAQNAEANATGAQTTAGAGAEQGASASDASAGAVIEDASAPSDPVAAAQRQFAMAAAARWPGAAGGAGSIIALARPRSGQSNAGSLTWVREGERTLVDARSYPISAQSVRALAAIDVGGDAGDEMVVFGESVDDFGSSAAVFSLPPPRDQALHDGARSAALDGTRSADEARSRLPLDRARTPEERAAMSNTAMLGQLVFASNVELTAALSARGVQVCEVQAPQGGRRRERCQRYAGRTLTERVLQSQVRERLRAVFDSMTTLGYQCASTPEQRCEAQRAGGNEIHVFIEGAGADRRIQKITAIDHMIGE